MDYESQIIQMYEHAQELASHVCASLYINGNVFVIKLVNGKVLQFNTIREVHHYLNGYSDAKSLLQILSPHSSEKGK